MSVPGSRKNRLALALAVMLAAAVSGQLSAEGSEPQAAPGDTPWLFIGPRIGAALTVAAPSDYNTIVQAFFPSSNTYFPVSSRLGVDLSMRFPLPDSGFRFSLEQLLAVDGLEQDFALPRYCLLVGVEAPFGLEAGIGPELQLVDGKSGISVGTSLLLTAGWRFSFGNLSIPVDLQLDPLPPDRRMRVSILSGVDFGFSPKPAKPRAPFNY